jgi:hypothetical protein
VANKSESRKRSEKAASKKKRKRKAEEREKEKNDAEKAAKDRELKPAGSGGATQTTLSALGFKKFKKSEEGTLVLSNSHAKPTPPAYFCKFCNKGFEWGAAFASHMKTHAESSTTHTHSSPGMVKDNGPVQTLASDMDTSDDVQIIEKKSADRDLAMSVAVADLQANEPEREKKKEPDRESKQKEKSGEKKSRKAYTFAEKAKWLRKLDELRMNDKGSASDFPLTEMARQIGCTASTLSGWESDRITIMTAAADTVTHIHTYTHTHTYSLNPTPHNSGFVDCVKCRNLVLAFLSSRKSYSRDFARDESWDARCLVVGSWSQLDSSRNDCIQ